ncbi:hypothetical protein PsYK624_079730 [Phanerochaete sordida]|uniref:Uncharacterized protein n=1 Tax=Phanerochaete sordida TaxID=48140 RepID=A0A9P3G9P3_9APHY|nr:hypothetical protein PsYK624_079730 [Phanerochaete sordida]
MTEAKLPEEIIHTILTLAIPCFSPESFLRYPRDDGPRWTQERPGALRVSKRWYRIVIPMVYEGVALSESKHTSALARLVKANPGVGRAIRYLRIEGGGMTRELRTLARHAPNIHTVYVSTPSRSADSLQQLEKLQNAVPDLRPTTLYIYAEASSFSYLKREQNEMVLQGIVEAWSSVTEIHFPYQQSVGDRWATVLQKLPLLREVHVPTPTEEFSPTRSSWFTRNRWWENRTQLEWVSGAPNFKRFVFHGEEAGKHVVESCLKREGLERLLQKIVFMRDKS